MGAKMVTLGHRILRTETAGMAVMSIIMFELEEDSESAGAEVKGYLRESKAQTATTLRLMWKNW